MKHPKDSGLLGLGVLACILLATGVLSSQKVSLGWTGLQVLWFLAIFLIVIPIHELGHAVAGLLVGFRIRSIIVGIGSPLVEFTIAGVSVRINLLPLAGSTVGTPRMESWVRLRFWVFAAGGPVADLELWVLRSGQESLLADHLPHPGCLRPQVGHPVLWCPIGWASDRALLKIDPIAVRLTHVEGALPAHASAVLLGPSKLAVLTADGRLGVVDLEARRGTWQTVPGASDSPSLRRELTEGGLGVLTRTAAENAEATLTLYALP